MKKFKGGLYADLSDYNTTLPNTEILLNFFKSNPIGYRSGGMVRGIAGGNPTGMRVTGGFLANAQKFAQGTSSDYPFDLLGKDYYTPGDRYVDPLTKTQISSYYKKPERLEKLLREKKIDIERPQGTFVPSTSPITKEDLPKWDKRARKFDTDKEKWVKFSKEEKEAAKKKYVDSLTSQYTSIMGGDYKGPSVYEGLPEDIVKEMQEGRISKKGYPGDRSAQRKFHTGPLPPSKEEIEAEKEKQKQKKYKNLNEYVKSETESDDSLTKSLDSMQTESVEDSIYPDAPEMQKPLDAEATFNKLMEGGGIKQLIEGNKTANAADIKTINKIGKSYYGKKGDKDAPAWALPLMISGFTMAASDNPDMLGAAAEGGIAGVGAYVAGEKEKKEDAKDQIELQLKKVDAIQKIKGRDLDVATLTSNMFSVAMQTSSADTRAFNEIELAKYKTEVGKINAIKDRLFEKEKLETEVDIRLSTLALDRDKFESDDAYKKALVELEIVKSGIQEDQHLMEVKLKYRDSGTKEQIIVKDVDGNSKPAEVRVYRDLETGDFKTEFIGWSPIDRDTMADWEEQIIKVVEQKFAEQIEDPKYAEMVENEIARILKERVNQHFETSEEATEALNVDLGNN